jgi:hypothetical protein
MKFYELSHEERLSVIALARSWAKIHNEHVKNLVITEFNIGYPPEGADMFRPELWKSTHWKWFDGRYGVGKYL